MAGTDGAERDRITTDERTDFVLDLRGPEPVIELGHPPAATASPTATATTATATAVAPLTVPADQLPERRDATQRARFAAVVTIAVLNALDLLTTYIAIGLGAHEGNPLVAWI